LGYYFIILIKYKHNMYMMEVKKLKMCTKIKKEIRDEDFH